MKNMKQISYITIGGFEGKKPVLEAIKEAKAMGFDGIELAFGNGELAPETGKDFCENVRREADKLDMGIDTLSAGAYWNMSLSSESEVERERAVDFTKRYIEVASWLGIRNILVIPGHVSVPWDSSVKVVPYKKAWELSYKSLKSCLQAAKKLKVNICLENVWNWFLSDPVSMREFIDRFDSDRVGSYFDAGNVLVNGYPGHWIEILGKRIKAVHIKNYTRSDCGGGLHGFGDDLEKGDMDWNELKKALLDIGYRGTITAEMIPFSRLPDLVLPDMELARTTAVKMENIFG